MGLQIGLHNIGRSTKAYSAVAAKASHQHSSVYQLAKKALKCRCRIASFSAATEIALYLTCFFKIRAEQSIS